MSISRRLERGPSEPSTLRLIAYVRTADPTTDMLNDFHTIHRWAESEGHLVVAELSEVGRSFPSPDAVEFRAAVAAIKAGRADGVVVAKVSRLGRDVESLSAAMSEVVGVGGRVFSCVGDVALTPDDYEDVVAGADPLALMDFLAGRAQVFDVTSLCVRCAGSRRSSQAEGSDGSVPGSGSGPGVLADGLGGVGAVADLVAEMRARPAKICRRCGRRWSVPDPGGQAKPRSGEGWPFGEVL